jgi:NitT/TauT family transport system substrate-binding protein
MRTSPRALLVALLAGGLLLVTGCGAPASGGAGPSTSAGASKPSDTASPASSAASTPAGAAPGSGPASAAAVPSAAGASAAYVPQPLDPPVKVRVGVAGVGAEASLYYAIDQGYLKDEGIEVELVPLGGNAADHLPALATGEIDFGSMAFSAIIFNSVARGIPIKVVAPYIITANDKSSGLVVRKDLVDSGAYRTLADLKGRTIALVTRASGSQFYLDHALSQAGLSRGDVEYTTVAFPDMVAALANQAVDAAWPIEPFITASETRGVGKAVIYLGEIMPGLWGAVVAAGPNMAARPDVLQRYVTALVRAQRDYHQAVDLNRGGKEAFIQSLMNHTPIKDPQQWEGINLSPMDPDAPLNLQLVDALQDFLIEFGAQTQKVDTSQAVDLSYLNQALQQLGPPR